MFDRSSLDKDLPRRCRGREWPILNADGPGVGATSTALTGAVHDQLATDVAYPRPIKFSSSAWANYYLADDSLVFMRACQDGERDVPGGPKQRINEFFYGDD